MFKPDVHRKIRLQRLPANKLGRDFIIGDIHGFYYPVMRFLRAVKFSPRKDRLFSVGDLIDRGPDSSRCLRLLNRPWFHCALGNHDIAFVVNTVGVPGMSFNTRYFFQSISDCGGEWYTIYDRRDLSALAEKLNARPHILTVGDKRVSFHVVHASLHPFNGKNPRLFADGDISLYGVARNQEDLVHSLIGERGLWRREMPARAEGLSLTCCGHNIVDNPRWALGHLNLDTGAGLDSHPLNERRISAFCFQTKEMWSIPLDGRGNVRRYLVPKMKRKRKFPI